MGSVVASASTHDIGRLVLLLSDLSVLRESSATDEHISCSLHNVTKEVARSQSFNIEAISIATSVVGCSSGVLDWIWLPGRTFSVRESWESVVTEMGEKPGRGFLKMTLLAAVVGLGAFYGSGSKFRSGPNAAVPKLLNVSFQWKAFVEASFRTMSSRHPVQLFIASMMFLTFEDLWNGSSAWGFLLRCLRDAVDVVSSPNKDVLAMSARLIIARVLQSQGLHSLALDEYRALLRIQEFAIGDEHPQTLTTRHNIASTLQAQGNHWESLLEYRAVLGIQTRMLGPDHLETLLTHHNLAQSLLSLGLLDDALAEFNVVLEAQNRTLGPEHPTALVTRHNIAHTLHSQGLISEALTEYIAVLAVQELVLGPEHTHSVATRFNIALALGSQGLWAEAEAEHEKVLRIRERFLGGEHPDTLTSLASIASLMDVQGRRSEALAEHRKVFEIRARTMGPEHRETKRAREVVKRLAEECGFVSET